MNVKHRTFIFALFLISSLLIVINDVHSQVTISATVTPSSFIIPRNSVTSRRISYAFATAPAATINVQSNQGTFYAGSAIIGVVSVPITGLIRSGVGRVSESVNIPLSITQKAGKMGATMLRYVRVFSDGTDSVQVSADFSLSTEGGADFRVERLQLYFDNRRAEITIDRYTPTLNAFVDIKYTGSGVLEGFWEVDGRLISHVKSLLVFGKSMTIKSPDIPPLPTFNPGTHHLRFVLTNPKEDISLPVVIYFVRQKRFTEQHPVPARVSPNPMLNNDWWGPTILPQGEERRASPLSKEIRIEGYVPFNFFASSAIGEYTFPADLVYPYYLSRKSYHFINKNWNQLYTFDLSEDR